MIGLDCVACGEEDVPTLRYLARQAFGMSADALDHTFTLLGIPSFRVMRRSGRSVGAAAAFHLEQWFGGRPVSSHGVALVMVDPAARGTGVGTDLMRTVLQKARTDGRAVSILYAASRPIYTKLGYERAGMHICWKAPTAALSSARMVATPILRDRVDLDELESLRRREALHSNGMVSRTHALWEHHLAPVGEEYPADVFILPGATGADGYLAVLPPRNDTLQVLDACILSRRVAREALAFLAGYASQAKLVQWYGGSEDALAHLAQNTGVSIEAYEHWLMRIVDVEKALTQRGYPLCLESEIVLDVIDPLYIENHGRFRLSVSKGIGQVERLHGPGEADLMLNITALAPLYTSHSQPASLRRMGALDGSDEAISRAALIFSGPRPWMADLF